MNHEPQLELTLLGWPSVRVIGADGASTEVVLPTKKALALLAYLALNGSTPRAELASLLWGDNTDAEAKKNLRQDVYRLLMTTAGAFLEVSRQHLGLRGAVTVDVRRVRDAAAIGDLERVTGLYHGTLLEGMSLLGAMDFEHWLEAERESLVHLQRAALVARARDQEQRGDLRGAIESVARQLQFDPLQEAPQRELMRLHWLLGERAQALGQFAKLSAVLETELGLEPSAETLALERQIRASEEALRFQGTLPFIGRAQAWSWLESTKGLALLIGEPGVGKTRLMREFAVRQKNATPSSLHLRGFETATSTAFYPVTTALLEHFERHPASFDALRPAWRLEVERLLPGHDGRMREPPSAEGRGWFIEAITQTLLTLAGDDGQILLDDLHWFDAASCELLTQLARRGQHLRLIATAGKDEYATSPAARAVEPLIRAGFASSLTLKPFVMGDLVALLHRLGGPHAHELIHCSAGIFETTGGNPLFFNETLHEALDAGVLHITQKGWIAISSHDHPITVTSSVREAIVHRIARLGTPVKRLLEAASLVSDSFSLETVSSAAGLGVWEAVETLETALSAQLIEPAGRGYRFAQNVTRSALADGLGAQRRALLHLGLAQALANAPGNTAQVALHLECAGRPQEAVSYRICAAQDAANAYAYAEALAAYDAALNNGADGETAFDIRTAKLKLFEALGDDAGWASELEVLEGLSAGSHAPVMTARVALARAEFEFHHGQYERAHGVLSALEQLDALPQDLRAGLLYRNGMTLVRLGRLEAADALLHSALQETRDSAPRGPIHHALSISAFHGGGIALAHEHNRAALTHFCAHGDRSGQAMTLSFAARLATTQGNPDAALEAIEEALKLARELHFVPLLRSALLNASAALLQVGDYEAAAVYLEEGSMLIQDARDPRTQGLYLTHGSAVLRMRGDLEGTIRAYRDALALFDAAQAMHPATFERLNLIDLLVDCGQIVEAKSLLAETAHLIAAHGFSDLQVWLEALRVKWSISADQPVRITTLQMSLREPQRLRVDVRHEALLALASGQLRLGDSRTAIETLGVVDQSPESPPENRARATAILLRAHGQHGSLPAWLQSDAQLFLEDRRVSPIAKLDLHHALAERSDETATPEPRRALHEAAQRLAVSLPINLRGAFIARWTRMFMQLEAAAD